MTEVQVSGFEYPHHLHTDSRFAMKRDVRCRQYPFEQTGKGRLADDEILGFDKRIKTGYSGIGMEQRFAIQLVVGLVGFRSRLRRIGSLRLIDVRYPFQCCGNQATDLLVAFAGRE